MIQATSIAIGISPVFGGGGGDKDIGTPDFLFEDGLGYLFQDGIKKEFEN